MQKHRDLTLGRINRLGERLQRLIHTESVPMRASFLPSPEPIPFDEIDPSGFHAIEPGTVWGSDFDCAWFRLEGKSDARFKGRQVVALVDLGGEACLYDKRGKPILGLTPRFDDRHGGVIGPKREIRLKQKATGRETFDLYLDAGANHLQGRQRRCEFRQGELCVLNEPVFKLYHEYRFLELLMLELPDNSRHGQLIMRCLNDVCNLLTTFDADEIAAARQRLRSELDRPARSSALEVSAIGHAHLDVAWLWPLRETARKCARTFSTALRMMEAYPDYYFGASQPHLYQMTKDHYPALYREIKKAVKAGRWEVQGGMWVESDCNIPSGESLVRQILHGKRFFNREFGIDVNHLWLPDVFGYSAALPQILKKSGIRYFTTHKLNWNQFNRFPHHTMYWQGLDGTKIFAHFMAGNDYNVPSTPRAFMNFERENRDGDRSGHALCLFGIGDGGGGPGRTHIEWTRLAHDLEDLPRVTMEKAGDFFEKAEAEAEDLLTWVGELYFEYHRGTYTSQALVKKMNRRLELLAREVEMLSAQLSLRQYPSKELDRIWKIILLNQFHDIIPGSSITRVYREAHEDYRDAEAALLRLRDNADEKYSRDLDTAGIRDPHVVVNSVSWERETIVFLPAENRILWADAAGTPLDSQRVKGGVLVRLDVPALGHNVIGVALGQQRPQRADLPASERKLENDQLRVEFAADGLIRSIFDKEANREVLAPGERGNILSLYEDVPLAFEAWDIDAYYLEKAPTHPTLTRMALVEHGPLRCAIEQVWEAEHYSVTQKISLALNSRILEFETEVDWHAHQRMLRVDFPVAVKADQATYEIQFGHVARPTHANTSWDMARFEVVAHRWADLSQPNYGVALLNDCKYGHRIHGNTISLNLLRSPSRPDPEADRHTHRFRYALYPHIGNHVQAEVVNRAYEFNATSRVYRTKAGTGARSAWYSFIESDCSNVIVDTIKRAEDSADLVIRLYEAAGIDCEVNLTVNRPVGGAVEVDLMEREVGGVDCQDNRIRLAFQPFEIRTLRISGS